MNAMSVIDEVRGLRAGLLSLATGAFGRSTFEYFTLSSDITSILPAPSTRSRAARAFAP